MEKSTNNMYHNSSQRNPNRPKIIGFVFFFILVALAIYEYYDLAAKEAQNTEFYISAYLAIPYRLGGKMAVSGTLIVFGIFMLVLGFFATKQLKKQKQESQNN